MAKEVIKTADSIKKWRDIKKIVKQALLLLLFILIILYIVLISIFQRGTFCVYNNEENMEYCYSEECFQEECADLGSLFLEDGTLFEREPREPENVKPIAA